jgi:hypothetical protein
MEQKYRTPNWLLLMDDISQRLCSKVILVYCGFFIWTSRDHIFKVMLDIDSQVVLDHRWIYFSLCFLEVMVHFTAASCLKWTFGYIFKYPHLIEDGFFQAINNFFNGLFGFAGKTFKKTIDISSTILSGVGNVIKPKDSGEIKNKEYGE